MKIYKNIFLYIFITIIIIIIIIIIFSLLLIHNKYNKKYCIIFIGPPYSGKSVLSKITADKTGLHNIAIGDILRNMINDNKLDNKIKNEINSGKLINEDIISKILINEISKPKYKNGFILDGFPRTLSNAIFLDKLLDKNNIVLKKIFYLYKDDDAVIKYTLNKPRKTGNNIREDDGNIKIIKKRLQEFHEKTEPLLEYYNHKRIPITFINSNIKFINPEQIILPYL